MQVVFRADASAEIGSGHVMRCLTLAEALRAEGADVLFVCRDHTSNLSAMIEGRGIAVARLPRGPEKQAPLPMHGHWLGADWQTDATETRAAMVAASFAHPAWLVVDHYAIDAKWQGALRADTDRIMVVDDLADRQHDCDLLLDQNLIADFENRYTGKVPAGAKLLLGPRYALLQPSYATLRQQSPARTGPVKRLLVYFGATDAPDLTGLTLAAFLALGREDIQLDLVVGGSNPHTAELDQVAADYTNVVVHRNLPSLAPLMIAADLAVGAGGATSWERLCLRLPAIVVTLADNQRPVAEELHRLGLVRWLGDTEDVRPEVMQKAIAEHISATPGIQSYLAEPHEVDGYGAHRVSRSLLEGL